MRRPVAEAVTASPEAAGAYYQGIDCLARRSSALGTARQCVPHFERALSFDPTFPLAHYQLARAGFLPGDSGEEARPHLQAAMDGIDRLPEREAKLLRALSERIEGRPQEALKLYDELLLTPPDDAEVLALASEVEVESGDWASAAGYLEREVAVVPDQEYPVLVLIEALGRQGEAEKLEALLNHIRAARPLRWRAVVEASLWLGERDAALEAARSAVAERGDAELSTLSYVLKALGEYGELEKVARRSLKAQPQSASASRDLEFALIGQGRIIEALRDSEANEAQRTTSSVPMLALRRAMFVAATRDPARVWPYAASALALDRTGADLAVVLALLGDLPHADRLAKDLLPGSNAEVQYRALKSLLNGDAGTAKALLEGLEAKEPWPIDGLAPSYLLAEVSAKEGDDAATLSAISRFDRLPADRIWRAWAYPRLLYLSAAAHLRLGDKDLAREELDRLLAILSRGDRTFLLLAQARSLKRAL